MRVGIIRYPGSNCDNDMLRYFENSFYIWHKEDVLKETIDLLVIPGGFAFGDRYYEKATMAYEIDPGKMAIESPVTNVILEAVDKKIPIFGVCNGFQILIKLGLLPGELLLNLDKKYTCKSVKCILNNKFIDKPHDVSVEFQVANSFGRYFIDSEKYIEMKKNEQIILTYSDDDEYNNGSISNIAGVCDENHMIFGMMPHPERTFNKIIKNTFINISKYNLTNLKNKFKQKIDELMKSEHISYKSTRKYLKKLYTKGEHVVQGPGENAGIVDIGGGYCIALRIESHNHPVFIEPYQGAATGVGGIMRDIFTMGARPIAIMDFLRFGTDDNSNRLLKETIHGIADYGNCFGVANVGGDLYRHEVYNKNPLLNVGCIGIVKKENIIYGNALNVNSVLIYVGSKTGLEGMDGASMASNEFTNDTDVEQMKDNVQKGDPFLERLLLEACCEIAENNPLEEKLLEGMQDMGAGGLLCSSLELIQRGREKTGKNLGCIINADRVPVKYYMDSCDKLTSESQERMLLVVKPDNQDTACSIFKKWDLEYSIVGYVDDSGYYSVINDNLDILYKEPIDNFTDVFEDWALNYNPINNNNITIKKTKAKQLWEQYDTTIGGRTLKGPQQRGSYSVLDIYEVGKQLIITWGEDVKTLYDKMIQLEANPLAIVNCLNFGHPRDVMGDFSDIVDTLAQECEKYQVPIVGGNVSLYNATDNQSIRATPTLVMIGIK